LKSDHAVSRVRLGKGKEELGKFLLNILIVAYNCKIVELSFRVNEDNDTNWPPIFGWLHKKARVISIPPKDLNNTYANRGNYQVPVLLKLFLVT
jgi:hypothetical protein